MILHLIRHGKTRSNLERRYIGSADEPLLDSEKERLASLSYPRADAVYSSPMKRAKETAAVIYPDTEPIILDGLCEISFGEFEGKTYLDLKDDPRYTEWIASGGKISPPGGEDIISFKRRAVSSVRHILSAPEAFESAAVITHGGVIMAVCEELLGAGFYDIQPPNGGVVSISSEKAGTLNDTYFILA